MSFFEILTQADITGNLTIQADLDSLSTPVLLDRLATLHRLQRESSVPGQHATDIIAHLNVLLARQVAHLCPVTQVEI